MIRCGFVVNIENMYLCRKTGLANTIYELLSKSKTGKYYYVKMIDTLTNESVITHFEKDDFEKNFYNISNLLCEECFVGKTGYYRTQSYEEKNIYSDLIILFKDSYYELLYDSKLESIYLEASIYKLNNFVELNINHNFPFDNLKIFYRNK